MRIGAAILLLLISVECFAATYYVATNGNNAADGSLATPWSNIWYAAKSVTAGDTVIIQAGEYNEYVTNTVSGTAGNPITFTGIRGAGGEWLTILDPSTLITTPWIAAPEIGTGVWKQTNMPFAVAELTIAHQRVAFVRTITNMESSINVAYTLSGLTNGADFLTLPSAATLSETENGNAMVTFWDSIKALWSPTFDAPYTNYMRLRDGSDPSSLSIRIARNHTFVTGDIHAPAVQITSKSYIIWSNMYVRGAFAGFNLDGALCHHNIIVSNSIHNGHCRVAVVTLAHDNVVEGNEITTDYYGWPDPGAWGEGLNPDRANLYTVSKYLMAADSVTFDSSVALSQCGSNNMVVRNNIHDTIGSGVTVTCVTYSSPYSITNSIVSSNNIEGHPSVGITLSAGTVGSVVDHNLISDCTSNIRLHKLNDTYDTNRLGYIYRNRSWEPAGVGNHIFTHWNSGDRYFDPTFWIYHNSFSGGAGGLSDNGYAHLAGGFTNFHYVNNIFSGAPFAYVGYYADIQTNLNMMGSFDYNLTTPPYYTLYIGTNFPVWYGTNCIKAAAPVWNTNSFTSFVLPAGSQAINSALDITVPFTLQGVSYPALPTGPDQRIGPAWDMGALEGGTVANAVTLRVGTLRGP